MATGDTLHGHRRPDGSEKIGMAAGDYCRGVDGWWWIRPPVAALGPLTEHGVVEHEDGTISVSPSIACDEWHGFLERGVWREA